MHHDFLASLDTLPFSQKNADVLNLLSGAQSASICPARSASGFTTGVPVSPNLFEHLLDKAAHAAVVQLSPFLTV